MQASFFASILASMGPKDPLSMDAKMPKLAKPLTDTQVKKAQAREKVYTMRDGGGIYLEVPCRVQDLAHGISPGRWTIESPDIRSVPGSFAG